MSRHPRLVWCSCPGLIPLLKFGTTGTTVGTVAKSAGSTARRNGSAVVVVMGGGSAISAITGGTERLICLFGRSFGLEQHMRHVAQARILGVEQGRVHLCGLPNDGVAH